MPRSRAGDSTPRIIDGWLPFAVALLAPMALAACGSGTSPTPPTPAAPSAIVHALDYDANFNATSVAAFSVAALSGELDPQGAVAAPGVRLLAVDPRGRYLYTSGYAIGSVSADYSFGSYAIDGRNGTLRLLSTSVYPRAYGFNAPVSMAVNERQLHTMIGAGIAYQSIEGRWAAFTIDASGGVVTDPAVLLLRFYDPLWVVAEPTSRFVYVGTAYPSFDRDYTCSFGWCVGVFTFALNPDGHLEKVGSTGVPTLNGEGNAAIQAGRFLLVPDDGGGITSFAMDATTGLLSQSASLANVFPKFGVAAWPMQRAGSP